MQAYQTPYKYGQPVLAPSGTPGAFDERAVDVPQVFWHNGRFYMTYVGFDGKGYQTALAHSADLLHWQPLGLILPRRQDGRWDALGAAGTCMLRESNDLRSLPKLKKVDGKYWMICHAYPGEGYEAGSAEMGLAWCEDEDLLIWHRLEQPILSWRDGAAWEHGGLYKAWLLEHDGLYYMFYNAKDKDADGWVEQTGVATSTDMMHWQRHPGNPVLPVTPGAWDSRFCSDPQVMRDGARWVMFYFGFDGRHAQEGIAASDDLLHWSKNPLPLLRHGGEGELDQWHAHKPAVVWHEGTLYHFYCACRPWQPGDAAQNFGNEFRCITVAMSRSLG